MSNNVKLEPLAAEALASFAAFESRGVLADRDRAIEAAQQALSLAPQQLRPSSRSAVAVVFARALRSRYRSTFDLRDLWLAVDALIASSEGAVTTQAQADIGAELIRAAGMLSEQVTLRTQSLLSVASERIRAALESAPKDLRSKADYLGALGNAEKIAGNAQAALECLEGAVATGQARPETRLDFAQALADSSKPRDRERASALLNNLAGDESAPREAFEAARFHGYWASQDERWAEAADAYSTAVARREELRRRQASSVAGPMWLSEVGVGSTPSEAAYALAQANRTEDAIEALEVGLATDLAERLGLAPGKQSASGSGSLVEPVVYLVVTERGGMALRCRPRRVTAEAVLLRALTRDTLHARLLPYAGSYRDWTLTRSPASARRWLEQMDQILAWLGAEVLWPALDGIIDASPGVTIVTDGVLGLLPLHAAKTSAGALIDLVSVRYAPTAAELANARTRTTRWKKSFLGVADPSEPRLPPLQQLPPLACARIEALSAATCFSTQQILLGADASLAAVESNFTDHGVLHFACHGAARFDDPRKSALALANGELLTLERIQAISLRGTRLAVLSACESGMQTVATPEEKTSLATGLLAAGAAAVVASLWAVTERSTTALLLRFYDLWRRGGADPCEALRQAQRWLRDSDDGTVLEWLGTLAQRAATEEEERALAPLQELFATSRPRTHSYLHPFYWAAFGYYGA